MFEEKYTVINAFPRETEKMKVAVKSKTQKKNNRKSLKSRNKYEGKADANSVFLKNYID